METKKKICPKCGQEDGSGQNHIHDMNPEHFVKIGRFYVLSEAIIPRKGERIRKDSPSERKTDRTTHQKSPVRTQIHISVHIKKEKIESRLYRSEKEIPPPFINRASNKDKHRNNESEKSQYKSVFINYV